MRRIDFMYEKYSTYPVQKIKEIMLGKCVKDVMKHEYIPNKCTLNCSACWNKEMTSLELAANTAERLNNE